MRVVKLLLPAALLMAVPACDHQATGPSTRRTEPSARPLYILSPPSVSITYPGGVPTISWQALPDAQSYSVTYVARTTYIDVANAIDEVNEYTELVGTTTGTQMTDNDRTYTGQVRCTWSNAVNPKWFTDYEYLITATYQGGAASTRVMGRVGDC